MNELSVEEKDTETHDSVRGLGIVVGIPFGSNNL